MLNPVETVREYSFYSNPRTPPDLRTPRRITVSASAPAGEMQKLKALASVKALHVSNLPSLGDVSRSESPLLTSAMRDDFRRKFRRVSGSWCCAPTDEQRKGAPRSAHFSL